MRTLSTLLFTTLVWTAALPAADPALLRLIPGNSAFVAGIRADQIRDSRFGQYILDQLKSEQASMDKFISATGFDPRRDLTELIVSSDDVKSKGKTVVVARGRFDATRIQSFAVTEGARSQIYSGIQLLSGPEANNHGGIAILDATTAVAGDLDSVKLAIDRFRTTSGPAIDARTAAQIAQLSAQYDAWMVSSSLARLADDIRDPQLGGAMNGNLFQSMQTVSGGVRFGANVEVMAEAVMRSEKDATAMVDVIKFLAGMIQLNAGQDDRSTEMLALLQKMELRANGTQFRMSLMIPEDTLEKLVKPAARRKPAQIL